MTGPVATRVLTPHVDGATALSAGPQSASAESTARLPSSGIWTWTACGPRKSRNLSRKHRDLSRKSPYW